LIKPPKERKNFVSKSRERNQQKEREEKKRGSKGRKKLLSLLNAKLKRLEGTELHVNRPRLHKLKKERRIPQNPLIKGRILREFDMSHRMKEGCEDGVDRVL